MPDFTDLIIVGAGPAGLLAGLEALEQGLTVSLFETDPCVGLPLNCAEAVTIPSVRALVNVEPDWIRATIHRGALVSPSGYRFELHHPQAGYILDRPLMEKQLAERFVARGGFLRAGHRVYSLRTKGNLLEAVQATTDKGTAGQWFRASMFIAADGIEGSVARMAGIDNRITMDTTVAYLQYHLGEVDFPPDLIEIHLGNKIARGSYLWVFPRGHGEVSVGLGTAVSADSKPRSLLERFVDGHFPGAVRKHVSCGGHPMYQGPAILADRNLLVVGDAARVLDSCTGAGIANAMLSGKLAGKAAAVALGGSAADLSAAYRIYPGEFLRQKGKELKRYAQIKKVIDRFTDDELDDIVESIAEVLGTKTVDAIAPITVFLESVKRKPRLLKLARHLF